MARGAAKKGYAKYVVLDDFRDKLHPDLLNNMDLYEKTYRMQYDLSPGKNGKNKLGNENIVSVD